MCTLCLGAVGADMCADTCQNTYAAELRLGMRIEMRLDMRIHMWPATVGERAHLQLGPMYADMCGCVHACRHVYGIWPTTVEEHVQTC